MVQHAVPEESQTPGVVPSGSAYRATVMRAGSVMWSCPHVHFYRHSAQTCAEQHLATTERQSSSQYPKGK